MRGDSPSPCTRLSPTHPNGAEKFIERSHSSSFSLRTWVAVQETATGTWIYHLSLLSRLCIVFCVICCAVACWIAFVMGLGWAVFEVPALVHRWDLRQKQTSCLKAAVYFAVIAFVIAASPFMMKFAQLLHVHGFCSWCARRWCRRMASKSRLVGLFGYSQKTSDQSGDEELNERDSLMTPA